jgi:multisubunit Na+/H+ antiporter MnhB subunit
MHDATTATHPEVPTRDPAARAFNTSILVSATRCLLTYVLFPWVLPLLGLAGDAGPAVGLVIGVVAIVCNVLSIRRFWRSRHRWRWAITAINTGVIGLLVVLIGVDLADLTS